MVELPIPILRAHPTAEILTEERCHMLELSNSEDDPEMSIARARVLRGRGYCAGSPRAGTGWSIPWSVT